MTDITSNQADLTDLTAVIVSAYVENNSLEISKIPSLIADVYAALAALGTPAAQPVPEKQAPAVSIKKSITPDFLICLEDGLKFKSLKRHLRSKYDMSPEDYRAKWGLASDYPMVAPAYAEQRSNLAKSMGLGRKAIQSKPARARRSA